MKFKKDPRTVKGSQERLAAIESYRKQVELHGEGLTEFEPFQPNILERDKAELAFAGVLVKVGILDEEDFLE